MTWKPWISALAAMALLGACGNAALQERALDLALGEAAAPTGQFPRFAPLLQAGQGPALDVRIVETGIRGGFLRESSANGIETWLGSDGVSLSFDRGVLHGTRGVGAGMLSSDVSSSARAIMAGRSGDVERIHTFLNGNNIAVSRAYACRITNEGSERIQLDIGTISARRMTEECGNLDQKFTNVYWVGRGRILQSRQWGGEALGELAITTVYNF